MIWLNLEVCSKLTVAFWVGDLAASLVGDGDGLA